ncbi:hypothetical protein B0J11DRAFT_617026 [Dendryphion nanum]|uniref:Uncharacterized protein n=1 Tax=Dendryphion nanum TaxID=256645 RepID=A0A9P9DIS8_9PLEO|nr:hypothetical protein B0J11DRAFT_617026 [Dendryphion nanum]
MRSTIIVSLLASIATALPTTPVEAINAARRIAARAPEEAKAVLKSVTSSGTGCAGNSGSFLIQDDATIGFDALTVDSASGAVASRCLITIDLRLDSKWKYTINTRSAVRGYVDGVSATFSGLYTVNGQKSEIKADIKPVTSGDGTYLKTFTQAGVSSALGGGVATVDVNLALVRETNKVGFVAVDTIDIGFSYSK